MSVCLPWSAPVGPTASTATPPTTSRTTAALRTTTCPSWAAAVFVLVVAIMAWIGTQPAAWHASDPVAPTAWLTPWWQIAMVPAGLALAIGGSRIAARLGPLAVAAVWLIGAGITGNGAGSFVAWVADAGNTAADLWPGVPVGNPADIAVALGGGLLIMALATWAWRRTRRRLVLVLVALAGAGMLAGTAAARDTYVSALAPAAQQHATAVRLLAREMPYAGRVCVAAWLADRFEPGFPPACLPWRGAPDPLAAATPGGRGAWLATAAGGVKTFGSAKFYGSLAGEHLASPIVGIAADPTGQGYWLAAADGGVFAFGDAPFYGSVQSPGTDTATYLASPRSTITGIAAGTSPRWGTGYCLVAADGDMFTFDASGPGAVQPESSPPHRVVGVVPGSGCPGTPSSLVLEDGRLWSPWHVNPAHGLVPTTRR